MALQQPVSIILCVLYGLLAVAYGWYFVKRSAAAHVWLRAGLVAVIVAHLVFFALGQWPCAAASSELRQMLSALALAMVVAYFLIEWASRERSAGVWVLSLAFLFQFVSAVGVGRGRAAAELPQSPLVAVHVGLALVGYCAFSLSAVFALMYLVLYHQIKIRRLGLVFNGFASLEALEAMAYRAIHFGVGFLILSLAVGERLLYRQEGRWVWGDAKILLSLAVCAFYVFVILLRKPWAIRGRRLAAFSVLGFGMVLVVLFGGYYLSGFHRFR